MTNPTIDKLVAHDLILDLYRQLREAQEKKAALAKELEQARGENADLRSKADPPDVPPSNEVDAP